LKYVIQSKTRRSLNLSCPLSSVNNIYIRSCIQSKYEIERNGKEKYMYKSIVVGKQFKRQSRELERKLIDHCLIAIPEFHKLIIITPDVKAFRTRNPKNLSLEEYAVRVFEKLASCSLLET